MTFTGVGAGSRVAASARMPLAGVIYITDRNDVAELTARVADDVGLWNPAISFRTMRDVKAQTRAAIRARSADHATTGRA